MGPCAASPSLRNGALPDPGRAAFTRQDVRAFRMPGLTISISVPSLRSSPTSRSASSLFARSIWEVRLSPSSARLGRARRGAACRRWRRIWRRRRASVRGGAPSTSTSEPYRGGLNRRRCAFDGIFMTSANGARTACGHGPADWRHRRRTVLFRPHAVRRRLPPLGRPHSFGVAPRYP